MPVGDVAERLRRKRISAVPVVDSAGGVVGIVSEHDLLTKPGTTAGEVMTTGVISVSEDTDVDDVRHLLVDRRIRILILPGARPLPPRQTQRREPDSTGIGYGSC
jgi:CBS domain-containing protein